MSLRPLNHTPGDKGMHLNVRNCDGIDNVYRWQTEVRNNVKKRQITVRNCTDVTFGLPMCVCVFLVQFKCCGLQTYEDWQAIIPDSCLCEGVDDSSECVSHSPLN